MPGALVDRKFGDECQNLTDVSGSGRADFEGHGGTPWLMGAA
ncbi:hypothetical protein ALP29_200566 [Pseudomonas syringae pv. avii]|uniref:Uncharacterized protein n=1 Tax=Pseudomonas syringae pv. avii TaxID=663959 RepID=A0A3M5TXC0_PSESX|nr:hypothetical protein ALP29_200566 [Pseudomonas syringae pv. avii]